MQFKTFVLLIASVECRSFAESLRVEGINGGMKLINTCKSTVKRLKKEPEDHEAIIQKGEQWTDTDFYRREQLYWHGFGQIAQVIDYWFFKLLGTYRWERLGQLYPDSDLFGDGATWSDINQGYAGTCYILAAMGAAAEYPQLIEDLFITN